VSDAGHRGEARTRLEFDHITPIACGGRSPVENLRVRCRVHNEYAAERAFGKGFMHEKRQAAQGKATPRRSQTRPRQLPR